MGQRTMVKLSASEDCVFLWTVSRGFRSPHRFSISARELQILEAKRHTIVSDIHSFAELRLGRSAKEQNADVLTVDFTWLSDSGGRRVVGRKLCTFRTGSFRRNWKRAGNLAAQA